MIKKYRKRPVVIDAVKLTKENLPVISNFLKDKFHIDDNGDLIIITLEGDMKASKGDYIIKGVKGEFYPCKPDIFEQSYEEVVC